MQLVSVVLCTYNGEKYLEKQIQSIINQTYNKLEIIINDDCSSDNTMNILEKYQQIDSRIKVFRNVENLGFNKNFETAIKKCKGDIIALCDQDDIWELNKIELQVEVLISQNLSMVYSNSKLINDKDESLNKELFSQLRVLPIFGKNPLGFIFGNCVPGHTIIFDKVLIDKIIPIPEVVFFDRWISFVASMYNGINFLPNTLVSYRQHALNVTDALRVRKKKKSFQTRIDKKYNAYKIRLKELEVFIKFIEQQNANIQIINDIYLEYTKYEKKYFNLKLFYILFKHRELIFAMKKNKITLCFKESTGFKFYKLFPFL